MENRDSRVDDDSDEPEGGPAFLIPRDFLLSLIRRQGAWKALQGLQLAIVGINVVGASSKIPRDEEERRVWEALRRHASSPTGQRGSLRDEIVSTILCRSEDNLLKAILLGTTTSTEDLLASTSDGHCSSDTGPPPDVGSYRGTSAVASDSSPICSSSRSGAAPTFPAGVNLHANLGKSPKHNAAPELAVFLRELLYSSELDYHAPATAVGPTQSRPKDDAPAATGDVTGDAGGHGDVPPGASSSAATSPSSRVALKRAFYNAGHLVCLRDPTVLQLLIVLLFEVEEPREAAAALSIVCDLISHPEEDLRRAARAVIPLLAHLPLVKLQSGSATVRKAARRLWLRVLRLGVVPRAQLTRMLLAALDMAVQAAGEDNAVRGAATAGAQPPAAPENAGSAASLDEGNDRNSVVGREALKLPFPNRRDEAAAAVDFAPVRQDDDAQEKLLFYVESLLQLVTVHCLAEQDQKEVNLLTRKLWGALEKITHHPPSLVLAGECLAVLVRRTETEKHRAVSDAIMAEILLQDQNFKSNAHSSLIREVVEAQICETRNDPLPTLGGDNNDVDLAPIIGLLLVELRAGRSYPEARNAAREKLRHQAATVNSLSRARGRSGGSSSPASSCGGPGGDSTSTSLSPTSRGPLRRLLSGERMPRVSLTPRSPQRSAGSSSSPHRGGAASPSVRANKTVNPKTSPTNRAAPGSTKSSPKKSNRIASPKKSKSAVPVLSDPNLGKVVYLQSRLPELESTVTLENKKGETGSM